MQGIPVFQFITWLTGEPVFAMDTPSLLKLAERHGVDVFVAWQMDYAGQQVARLLIQHVEGEWAFFNEAGERQEVPDITRPTVSRDVYEWALAFVNDLRPLRAIPIPRHAWEARENKNLLYTPFGFNTPARLANDVAENTETGQYEPVTDETSAWIFDWCPTIVTEQIMELPPEERPVYLEAMYARLCWWTEHVDTPVEERERMLDDMLYENNLESWTIVNRVHMRALDRQRG